MGFLRGRKGDIRASDGHRYSLSPWNTGWSASGLNAALQECHSIPLGSCLVREEANQERPLSALQQERSCAFQTTCRTKAGERLLQPNSNSRSQSVSSYLHSHSRGKTKWKPQENKSISERLGNVTVQLEKLSRAVQWLGENKQLFMLSYLQPRAKREAETSVPFILLF